VLLLDEPLSNLDANLRIQMRREIRELQQRLNLTTIFVTHDQEEANTTSDRMAVLNDGVIQQIGAPMDLYDQPANLFVASFLGTANVFRGVIDQQGGQTLFQSDSGMQFPLESAERGERSIVFRPQSVTIGPVGELDQPRFDGTVHHLEFLGNIIRYAVQVGRDTVLVDDPHQGGTMAFPVGAAVSIGLKADQILTLPA
jgi:iron(III) transport system ATP-binding protein